MRISRATLFRVALVLAFVAALEALCRVGIIGRLTMIPPSEMVLALIAIVLHADWFWTDFAYTVRNLVAAAIASILLGYALGLLIHAMPRMRRALEPVLLSYYSVPTFVFYPLLVVVFGIGPLSLIALGTIFAVVAMLMSTLTAIDRIPRGMFKVARITRLTPLQTLVHVKLPAAAPHLFTGVKLAVIYSVIGTCRLVGVNPEAYIRWVLPKLAAASNQTATGLLPHDFARLGLDEPCVTHSPPAFEPTPSS